MFKVVADQLKVSDGWVRCGHCDSVFDASAHFQAPAEPAELEVPEVPELVEVLEVAEAPPATLPTRFPAHFPNHLQPDDASVSASLSSYLSAPESPDADHQDDAERSPKGTDRRSLFGSRGPGDATPTIKPLKPAKPDDTRRPLLSEVTFVQSAQRRNQPQRPIYRLLAMLFAVAGLLVLVLQVLVHERDALAARYPALLPALQVVCQKMDCQIHPQRVIEAIVIDSSSFTKTGQDAYRLNVVLKNMRSAAVAMPALEVTLTGSQNEVLMRKVLLPAELGSGRNVLTQVAPFTGVFDLMLSSSVGTVSSLQGAASTEAVPAENPTSVPAPAATPLLITGYRLFVFYP